MSTQVLLTLNTGQVVSAVNYRMPPTSPPSPSVPASPNPFSGGVYHVQTPMGWVDILATDITNIAVSHGVTT